MKRLVTLFCVLFAIGFAYGQNTLVQPFGTKYETVREFLESKPGVHANFDQRSVIVASTEGFRLTYYFNDGDLYKTELLKQFNNRKTAKTTMEAFRDYYKIVNAEVVDVQNGKDRSRFVALADRELHEVIQFSLSKSNIQVKQVKMDLDFIPGDEYAGLQQEATLFTMLNK